MYQGPYNDDWIGFDQLVHQVIWFDEFRGQLTIQQMNAICDVHTRLNVKGSSIMKTKRVLVIVCSNYTIKETYKKAVEDKPEILESLLSRFHEVEVKRL